MAKIIEYFDKTFSKSLIEYFVKTFFKSLIEYFVKTFSKSLIEYFDKTFSKSLKCLIGVCETTHTTHDTEDVVVNGIDVHGSTVWISCEVQLGVIDS
jgi:hypothetical protein